jgi:ABC-type uncharacterized transport system substrate-binding protein
MKRRELLGVLGGAAATWLLTARAQQGDPLRRIGVLMILVPDDPEGEARLAAFAQGLQELAWVVGRNVQIDYRWGAGDPDRTRKYAEELVALMPDVILASGTSTVAPLQRVTRTVPIVFANVVDPVGAGFVASLARPGGNATGFTPFEFGMSGKWLELLKQITPNVTRAAVIRDTTQGSGTSQLAAIQAVRRRSGWTCVRSTREMPARSSAVSLHSRASRTAALS